MILDCNSYSVCNNYILIFQRGVASLLRSKKIFSTLYHSSAIHVVQTGNNGEVKLVQSLSLVYDLTEGYGKGENVARRIIGSLGLFPCSPASKTSLQVWKDNAWVEVDPSKINSLTLSEIPETGGNGLQFIFTPSKFLGGNRKQSFYCIDSTVLCSFVWFTKVLDKNMGK